jgi:predicted ATPase
MPAYFTWAVPDLARANNLPAEVSTFVGREPQLAELIPLLASSRLLTLTGAGGVGKTRLALEIARQVTPDYPDGVWLVELASLSDPTLVSQFVAVVLGVPEQPGRPLLTTLANALRPRRLLLVLDSWSICCTHPHS